MLMFNYAELKEKHKELVNYYSVLEGFGSIPLDLNTIEGQNIVRLVGYRVIQELYEADIIRVRYHADTPKLEKTKLEKEFHEELIDSFFFMLELDILTDLGDNIDKAIQESWELLTHKNLSVVEKEELDPLSLIKPQIYSQEWYKIFWNTSKAFCHLIQILRIRPWRPPEKALDYTEFRTRLFYAGQKLIELFSNRPDFLNNIHNEYNKKWETNLQRAQEAIKYHETAPIMGKFSESKNITHLLNNRPTVKKEK
jgi:hypothetical protein